MTYSRERIREMAAYWMPSLRDSENLKTENLRLVHDTTDFFKVEFGDILLLRDRPYLVRNSAREERFGLGEDIKQWVKHAVDLESGERKIIKLVFHERFTIRVGNVRFDCYRSPAKESRILALVNHHQNFMHGFSFKDDKGNLVRILDYIYGKTLSRHVENLEMDHQKYFVNEFPEIFRNFLECVKAVRFLHNLNEKHGDIRRDHIIIDRETGNYRWIDFDFNYWHRENIYGYDLFSLGSLLIYLAGKGDFVLQELCRDDHPVVSRLTEADINLVWHNRIANLQKIFPYIPESFNRILLAFSKGAHGFYENADQFLEDLNSTAGEIFGKAA